MIQVSEFAVRLRHFGSFIDSGSFRVTKGINTFIGVNNAGKTALLFALVGLSPSSRARQLPYPLSNIGEAIKRYKRPESDPIIEVEIPMGSSREQILTTLCGLASQPNYPNDANSHEALRFVWVLGNDESGLANIYCRVCLKGQAIEKELLRMVHQYPDKESPAVFVAEHPFGFERPTNYTPQLFPITPVASRSDLNPFKFNELPNKLLELWPHTFNSVVFLSTHRNAPSRAQHNHTISLDPLAANLPQVLATIQMSTPELVNGREIFDEIQGELRALFPEIRRIRTEIVSGDRSGQPLEVEVKFDLTNGVAVPLSHSGTGVQQILSLLTGAYVCKRGSLFLLDEPHSYLHPAAERGLLKTLERLSGERDHYFCIATHSPIFASYSRSHLYAVRATAEEGSKIRSLSVAADILDALGVSNPDLFTYSRVIFVEGPSDEKVISAISEMLQQTKSGDRVKVQAMGGDGILKNRSRAEFIALLHKANVSEIHVPIRFILDSNDWSKEERQKLGALTDPDGYPVVHFLNLPELENYLLHPAAIVYALKQCLTKRNAQSIDSSIESVEQVLSKAKSAKGSDMLDDVFSQYGCDYTKNKDVDSLLSYIVANCPNYLNPLIQEVSDVLGVVSSQRSAKQQSAATGKT